MNTASHSSLFAVLAMLAALWGASACSTTGVAPGQGKKVNEPIQISKGMEAVDLIAALGEPDEVLEATPAVEGTEIWVYRKVSENVSLVVSGIVETPALDLGGIPMTVKDAVYSPSRTRQVQETQFLMVNGIMTAWKVHREGSEKVD